MNYAEPLTYQEAVDLYGLVLCDFKMVSFETIQNIKTNELYWSIDDSYKICSFSKSIIVIYNSFHKLMSVPDDEIAIKHFLR